MGRYKRKKGFFGFGKSKNRSRGYNDFDSGSAVNYGNNFNLSSDTKRGIFIIIISAIAALSILALFDSRSEGFFAGFKYILALAFGSLKFIFPIALAVWAYVLLRNDKYKIKIINYIGAILLILGLTGLFHLKYIGESVERAQDGLGGGYLGLLMSWPLLNYMNFWGGLVVCVALFLIGLLLCFEMSVHGLMWPINAVKYLISVISKMRAWSKERKASRQLAQLSDYNGEEEVEEENYNPQAVGQVPEENTETEESDEPKFSTKTISDEVSIRQEEPEIYKPKKFGKRIDLPFDLVSSKAGKPTSGDIKNNQEIIKKTLGNFGIPVEMGLVNIGPTVTQFTLRPADGVKLSRITNLNSDLALALAAHPIRIEAPIPGKALVGIEIPNQMAAKVTMGELLMSKEYKERIGSLAIALGKDVSGKPYFANLDKMPHLLVAGATGSGKSVCINSIIVSLLYQNSPDELKFILVDPKRVELTVFNKIPYLLTPVITDVKKTVQALKWAVVEMERRFELLSKVGKRNIGSFNQTASEKLPYIVFVIDELADLMASASADIEGGIVRLAQMARAVGIHLILATQRPSVEVITGLIKANIPARISFAVSSLIDSRTILDSSGAEKLVGRGDMLYLGPEVSRPKRLQGVYLSDKEIFNVINYIKQFGEADYLEEINDRSASGPINSSGSYGSDDGDSLLGEAKEIIVQSGKASASLLQRRLKIGYARAARILDLLEEQGIIGPSDGAKAREVFLDKISQNINPVQFAAREHDLEGEMRAIDGIEEEPSYTAFTRVDNVDEENEAFEELEEQESQELEEIIESNVKEDNIEEEIGSPEAGISQEAEQEEDETEQEVETDFIVEEIEDGQPIEAEEEKQLDEAKEEFEENGNQDNQPKSKKTKGGFFDDGEWS